MAPDEQKGQRRARPTGILAALLLAAIGLWTYQADLVPATAGPFDLASLSSLVLFVILFSIVIERCVAAAQFAIFHGRESRLNGDQDLVETELSLLINTERRRLSSLNATEDRVAFLSRSGLSETDENAQALDEKRKSIALARLTLTATRADVYVLLLTLFASLISLNGFGVINSVLAGLGAEQNLAAPRARAIDVVVTTLTLMGAAQSVRLFAAPLA
jgi:hypothetical protein